MGVSTRRKVRTLALQFSSDPQTPTLGMQFCATQAYEGSRTDELSVPAGARVHVLETSDRGWWLCRYSECAHARVCVHVLDQWQVLSGRRGTSGKSLTKPCLSCRYNGQEGLFPAVLLQPEGLCFLLGRPGLPDCGREAKVAADRPVPPVVPTRPCVSAIQSRCCTITRRALKQDQRTLGPL